MHMSINQYPNEGQQKKSGTGGCLKAAGIGCGVLILILVGLGIYGYNAMMKNPQSRQVFQQSQSMGACAGNLAVVGKALKTYSNDHGGAFPASLADLYPKYIPDQGKLLCPQTGPGGTAFRYEYKQPSPSAPENTVVVTCRQHVVMQGQPPILVYVMKNGKVETDTSGMQSGPKTPTPPPAPTKP